MKPRTSDDWLVVLDAIEWFQRQLRQMTPEQVREWISKDALSPAPASQGEGT